MTTHKEIENLIAAADLLLRHAISKAADVDPEFSHGLAQVTFAVGAEKEHWRTKHRKELK